MHSGLIREERAGEAELEPLMIRYQQGDSSAATALVEHLSGPLLRYFGAQPVGRRYADDLLQETWMRIHQARHTYRPGSPVRPWVFAIGRHVQVDHYRRLSRRERRELQVETIPEHVPLSQEAATPRLDLAAVLGLLPESQRQVIAMLKVSGMSLEEVARATASTVGSVKQKAHRAYTALSKILMSERKSTKEQPSGTNG